MIGEPLPNNVRDNYPHYSLVADGKLCQFEGLQRNPQSFDPLIDIVT
jgi:hypothetical protein